MSPLNDTDLLEALATPDLQKRYPRDSKAFVRIDTSLRAYWHTLFDVCPALLDLAGPDGLAIFRPFMAWAASRRLSMNWAFYIWAYRWLDGSDFADSLPDSLAESMLAASAARWATVDRGRAAGIVLGDAKSPGLIAGWKCRSVDGARSVERIELEAPLAPPCDRFGFFLVPGFALETFPGWSPIPL
ncbi:methanobactin biosynthesis cassette protein MbnC [Cupriavidus basilensis]|uniref:Methanobactin biosynthesis cassette protein MbnC n=1 Tax=Cupriavidus basilensis TaxID=68895 RepID=A0ABT6AJ95_9BURK|nr:methanobactin biosynthesis protein MbnC [Cupriavidus basilensis]MDF3832686.1 methanobactin biosynthesis cassette protein MbnC [Cupriavidus basilensis]